MCLFSNRLHMTSEYGENINDTQGVGNKKLWNYNIWFYLFFFFLSFSLFFFPLSLSQCHPLSMLGKDIFKLGKQSFHPFFFQELQAILYS